MCNFISSALRKNTPPKILMNLCLSLILMQIIFFVGVERGAKSKVACQAVGFLLQYSFLAIFAWNFVEGFHSMRGIAAPMKAEISRFLPKASLFAWGMSRIYSIQTVYATKMFLIIKNLNYQVDF